MFLNVLQRRNPRFLESVAALHARGDLPANTTAIDIDALRDNTLGFVAEARRLGLTPFAMTKQIGRNRDAIETIIEAGIERAVAVDLEGAIAVNYAGMRVGHLGHLVQVPRHRAAEGVALRPEYWTVFSYDKAREISDALAGSDVVQDVLLRITAAGDLFYRGHEGGFLADHVVEVAEKVNGMPNLRVRGITTFPAMLFNPATQVVEPTANARTLEQARESLLGAGMGEVQVNAPGTTSLATLKPVADFGATQVEPGHGLTGTTPWHAFSDLTEDPALVYVTEVSHVYGDDAYIFGGGLYGDPVLPGLKPKALSLGAGGTVAEGVEFEVEMPNAEAIDYYAVLPGAGSKLKTGDTILMGFRPQVFVTRSLTAGITGVRSDEPRVAGVYSANGSAPSAPALALERKLRNDCDDD